MLVEHFFAQLYDHLLSDLARRGAATAGCRDVPESAPAARVTRHGRGTAAACRHFPPAVAPCPRSPSFAKHAVLRVRNSAAVGAMRHTTATCTAREWHGRRGTRANACSGRKRRRLLVRPRLLLRASSRQARSVPSASTPCSSRRRCHAGTVSVAVACRACGSMARRRYALQLKLFLGIDELMNLLLHQRQTLRSIPH